MSRPFNAPKPLPDMETLNQMLSYCPSTGDLTWKPRADDAYRATWWNAVMAGKKAGSAHSGGYLRLMIDGAHHMAHRVIWKMMHGFDPVQVDHINGVSSDNRLENLRDVSHQINSKNRKLYRNNTSGIPGLMFHTRDNVWVAKIGVRGKQVQLGSFCTKEEGIAAIIAAHVLLDYHENHGRSALNEEN